MQWKPRFPGVLDQLKWKKVRWATGDRRLKGETDLTIKAPVER